ncbi:hypothetical protein AYO49_01735 [Verrucomicrobiaceae bacterium SCGC AG-212-N21]|nr:hypothetical protein AYO49_01735 [Verrucomicrobiaceae bacterium SCGC AG-212-N21]
MGSRILSAKHFLRAAPVLGVLLLLDAVALGQETPAAGPAVAAVRNVLAFSLTGSGRATPPEPGSYSTTLPAGNIPTLAVSKPGSVLATGADSAASVSLGPAATARMGSETEIRVPDEGDTAKSLEMLKGRLFLSIGAEELKKSGAGEFRLKTPAALLAVKGTKFFAISKDGVDTLGVHEGSVAVLDPSGNAAVTLQAGQAVTVDKDGIGTPRPVTEEEKTYVAEYAAAAIFPKEIQPVATQVTGNLKVGATQAVWSPSESYVGKRRINNSIDKRPTIDLATHTVRYAWSSPTGGGAATNHVASGVVPQIAGEPARLVALGVRLRHRGAEEVKFQIGIVGAKGTEIEVSVPASKQPEQWQDILIPFPVDPGKEGFRSGLSFRMSWTAAPSGGALPATPAKTPNYLEAGSFQFLCTP